MVNTPPEGSGKDGLTKLGELDARIKAARAAKEPHSPNRGGKFSSAGMAWRMVFELIVSMVIGAGMGWGLDSLFGTLPLFLIIFWLLGFASGIRTVMYSAKEAERIAVAEQAAETNKDPNGGS